jgi:hypothetical protein
MRREDLLELHYITPIGTVPSIEEHGILCHAEAQRLPHRSVALEEVQERRRQRPIPGGMAIHRYANLYINARNPALFRMLTQPNEEFLCVLGVSCEVLDLPGVVITDQNAASDHRRCYSCTEGIAAIDRATVFSTYWTHDDPIEQWRHKSRMCAEVLVPDRVEPRFLLRGYVPDVGFQAAWQQAGIRLPLEIRAALFFR